MSIKSDRLNAMRRIVAQHEIENQDMLLDHLRQEGYVVTQATLSRDLKQLKISKNPNYAGIYVYMLPNNIRTVDMPQRPTINYEYMAEGFLSIEFSGQLAVMKTRPGHASAIAYEIDTKAPHIILGTVAGDDTILIVPRENISRRQIMETLGMFIPNLK